MTSYKNKIINFINELKIFKISEKNIDSKTVVKVNNTCPLNALNILKIFFRPGNKNRNKNFS